MALLLIGGGYFTIRTLKAGILFLPAGAGRQPSITCGAAVSGLMVTLIGGILAAWRNIPLFRDGRFDSYNAARLGVSALVFFLA